MAHSLVLSIGFGLVTASIVALAAVSVTLQFGVMNYVNFAYGSYLALAAYIAWELNARLAVNFWLSVGVTAVLMAVFATLLGRYVLQPFARRPGPRVFVLIVTLGLWLVVSNALLIVWGSEPRQYSIANDSTLNVGPFLLTTQQVFIMVVSVAVLVCVHLVLAYTKLGKSMRAVSDNRDLAAVSGINEDAVITITWIIVGLLIGLAGCVLALNLSSFQPGFGDDIMFVIFSAVILGGIGHPYGAMLGAGVIGLATEMSAVVVNSAFKSDIAFVVLIVMLFVRPQGLIPAPGRH